MPFSPTGLFGDLPRKTVTCSKLAPELPQLGPRSFRSRKTSMFNLSFTSTAFFFLRSPCSLPLCRPRTMNSISSNPQPSDRRLQKPGLGPLAHGRHSRPTIWYEPGFCASRVEQLTGGGVGVREPAPARRVYPTSGAMQRIMLQAVNNARGWEAKNGFGCCVTSMTAFAQEWLHQNNRHGADIATDTARHRDGTHTMETLAAGARGCCCRRLGASFRQAVKPCSVFRIRIVRAKQWAQNVPPVGGVVRTRH